MSRMDHANKIPLCSVNNLIRRHANPTNINTINEQKKLYKD